MWSFPGDDIFTVIIAISHTRDQMGGLVQEILQESSMNRTDLSIFHCNIIKGTMRGDTFEMLHKAIGGTPLWERMLNESFKGKFADKIERAEKEMKG